jgi:hypothetical protein
MIKLNYTVHSVTTDQFEVDAIVAGTPRKVSVPGLVIEAVSQDGSMGHSFRFIPDDSAAAIAAFVVGSAIVVSIEPAKG